MANFSSSPTPEEDELPNFLLVLTQKGTVYVFVCLVWCYFFFPVSVCGLYINTTRHLIGFSKQQEVRVTGQLLRPQTYIPYVILLGGLGHFIF